MNGINSPGVKDIYLPMRSLEGDASVDAELQVWMKFRTLSRDKKDILVSHELIQKMQDFEARFHLQEVGVSAVSLAVRKIFFGELDLASAEAKIASMFLASGAGDPNQAKAIVEAIQKEIFTIKPAPEAVSEEDSSRSDIPVVKTVRLPLLKAMSQYRHLSEQILTNEKIKLKSSMEPLRPSLGNWLKSYREEIGIGFHETALRGNFLFQSPNGKRLTNDDRARLNLVLKSVEEEFPLEIDPKKEVIIFPAGSDASMELTQVKARPMDRVIRPRGLPVAPATGTGPSMTEKPLTFQVFKPLFAKPAAPEKNVSGETLHFSTGHVLPSEREAEASLAADSNKALRQMQHPTQAIKRELKAPLTKSPYSIRPLRSRNSNTGSV